MGGAARATSGGLLAGAGDYDDEDGRMLEWEHGLPSGGDLAPLSQTLITPELASAFGIRPEPPRTLLDVHRASSDTISSLRQTPSSLGSESGLALGMLPSVAVAAASVEDPVVIEGDESGSEVDGSGGCYDKARRLDAVEEADSSFGMANTTSFDGSARAQKRPRLVWTFQLHKRFVDVVAYLGIKNSVPKAIMHLMNVEGLTRENVASHLQKYRLYLKRNEGLSSDHLVASTPVPQRLQETPVPVPMPYAAASSVVPMRVVSMAQSDPRAHVTVVPLNSRQHGICGFTHLEEAPRLCRLAGGQGEIDDRGQGCPLKLRGHLLFGSSICSLKYLSGTLRASLLTISRTLGTGSDLPHPRPWSASTATWAISSCTVQLPQQTSQYLYGVSNAVLIRLEKADAASISIISEENNRYFTFEGCDHMNFSAATMALRMQQVLTHPMVYNLQPIFSSLGTMNKLIHEGFPSPRKSQVTWLHG
ncbi:hypothetical protein Taro_030518 [Colocasia esculenta]|uniref:Myb-like domain-containing protein n=1 Tax=Colocasia esculenta TaxID=4460 RepID=A0A843VML9_COLES|nr:hypothetical protein [Colocasia esculenta]